MLFIPWLYAFQGDNPMQSEVSSHIGLTGKYFCQICDVHRYEKSDEVNGAVAFMKVCYSCIYRCIYPYNQEGTPWTKQDTLVQLRAQLDFILKGFVSKLDHLQRDSGVKDNHFSRILE